MNRLNTFRRLIKIISPYKVKLVLTLVSAVVISLVSLLDSFLLSYAIDNILVSNAKLTLVTISIIMMLVVFLSISLTGIKSLLIQRISYSMDVDLMRQFYSKIFLLPFPVLEKHKSGELTSRLNDTTKVRNALSYGLISILTNFITFIIVGIALMKLNTSMFLISCIFIILLVIVAVGFCRIYKKLYPLEMEKYSDLQAFTTESFTGIETILTMPATNSFLNEFKKRQLKTLNISWNIEEKCVLQDSIVTILSRMSSIILMISGFYFVMKQKISLGQVAAFLSLNGFFSNSIDALINLQASIQESFAAINRLFEILSENTCENHGKINPGNSQPTIFFDKINFSYSNDKQVYENFSLIINPGEWVSLVGKTGCGKTTLTKLLLKFYKAQNGKIFWNDVDLLNIDRDWLYSKIAYIPQDIVLFAGTIIDNITLFNKSYDKEKIIEISRLVGIYDKIMSLPDGFYSLIGENGASLSGGEKQKIAIARALLKNPLLMIFDEATSNLDVFSEKQIIQTIKELHKNGLTIITIAHRLSTINDCDRIIVLENGKIIEEGKHIELIKKNGIYNKMIN